MDNPDVSGEEMMQALALGLAAAVAAFAYGEIAYSQSISGEIGVFNKYLDYDLLVLTDEPVVQAALYAQFSDACSLMAWGSHGVSTTAGGELDVGGICWLKLNSDTTLTVYAMRSLLWDAQDASTIAAGITHGDFDIMFERYFWDEHAGGVRIYGGYAFQPMQSTTIKPMLVYEGGLGMPEVLGGGVNASYALSEQLELVGLFLSPLVKHKDDIRDRQLLLGVRWKF